MLVLSLCQQFCADKIPVKIGKELGNGADGQCFSIAGDPDRVLKLCVLYERPDFNIKEHYQNVQNVLDYIMNVRPCPYVRVYEHGYLGSYSRKMPYWTDGEQRFIMHYYIMEKMEKISDDEVRVFHSILSHEDCGIVKNYSSNKIRMMLEGMNQSLDFNLNKIMFFCDMLKKASLIHADLHPRNILKDLHGNFKAIDLDRCELMSC